MIKVGVIFGGESVEHEVSIISAVQAMNKMDNDKYDIVPIYITKDRQWYTGEILREIDTYRDMNLLKRYATNVVLYNKDEKFVLQARNGMFKRVVKEIDIAFPIVHGTNMEDGTLQGYLRMLGIPFVGSDVLASAIAQDKIIQKQVFEKAKLPITDYVWFYDSEYLNDEEAAIAKINKLKYPLIIKPATLGSSIGIEVVASEEELRKAIDSVINYDTKILVEEVVSNLIEVNISVVGNHDMQNTSAIEEVLTDNSLLTYEDKYLGNSKKCASKGMASTNRRIPADVTEKMKEEIEKIAIDAFLQLDLSGNVRIDFLVDDKKKKVYINEVNSCPGSLAFYLWEPTGKSYTALLDDMINIGIKDYKKRTSKIHSFNSNILAGYNGTKGVKGIKTKLK